MVKRLSYYFLFALAFLLSVIFINGLHGIDERIKKEDFLNGIRSYVKIIELGTSQ